MDDPNQGASSTRLMAYWLAVRIAYFEPQLRQWETMMRRRGSEQRLAQLAMQIDDIRSLGSIYRGWVELTRLQGEPRYRLLGEHLPAGIIRVADRMFVGTPASEASNEQ